MSRVQCLCCAVCANTDFYSRVTKKDESSRAKLTHGATLPLFGFNHTALPRLAGSSLESCHGQLTPSPDVSRAMVRSPAITIRVRGVPIIIIIIIIEQLGQRELDSCSHPATGFILFSEWQTVT